MKETMNHENCETCQDTLNDLLLNDWEKAVAETPENETLAELGVTWENGCGAMLHN